MKLTKIERWILANQYIILEKIDPDQAEYYKKCQTILKQGYELHYDEISQDIKDSETMSREESSEVLDILDMFSDLKRSYKALKDKSGVETSLIKFLGFDGNDTVEAIYLDYALFFCNSDGGRYKDLERGDDFNSHAPMLNRYKKMLAEWKRIIEAKKIKNPMKSHELGKEDIIRIASV